MFKMLRNVRILPLIATGFLFFALTGCPASPASTGGGGGGGGTGNSTNAILPWTVIVYLDADNNLEAAGLQDINEMEAGLTNDNIYLLVLVDRVNGYDSSDGDWKGTRLYRVRYDTNGLDATIRSERLAAGINGINLKGGGELEEMKKDEKNKMGGFIAYCQTNYKDSN